MKDFSMIRHDGLVDKVKEELIHRGFNHLFDHIEYSKHKHCGEIDVYAQKDNYVLLFEIKGNDSLHNYTKAIKQMTRAERFYFDKGIRLFKFYVCYDCKDNIQYKWVKHR